MNPPTDHSSLGLPFEIDHNSIVVQFKSVQLAKLYWRNQFSNLFRDKRPEKDTYAGEPVEGIYSSTVIELMRKGQHLDKWIPVFKMKLAANNVVTFEGRKAIEVDRAYRAWLFASNKKK